MSEENYKLVKAVITSRRIFRLLASGQVGLKDLIAVANDALVSIDQNLGVSDERLNEIVQQYMIQRYASRDEAELKLKELGFQISFESEEVVHDVLPSGRA